MASLDQAFIKAFQQPAGPATSGSAWRMTLSEAIRAKSTADEDAGNLDQENATVRDNASSPQTGGHKFRAMLQVDGFAWPKTSTDGNPVAEAQLDQLAAGLLGNNGVRRTVLALAGCAPGAGCATLLLGVARRLARHGVNLVLMDANAALPRLASRLGLLPEMGWEVVAAGRLPVAEVLIESIADRMTLLPLCDGPAVVDVANDGAATMASSTAIQTLRQHYDVVLVDLGVPDRIDGALGRWLGEWIDAVALVKDVRAETPRALLEARDRLAAFGINVAGVVENFVPQEAASAVRDAA